MTIKIAEWQSFGKQLFIRLNIVHVSCLFVICYFSFWFRGQDIGSVCTQALDTLGVSKE